MRWDDGWDVKNVKNVKNGMSRKPWKLMVPPVNHLGKPWKIDPLTVKSLELQFVWSPTVCACVRGEGGRMRGRMQGRSCARPTPLSFPPPPPPPPPPHYTTPPPRPPLVPPTTHPCACRWSARGSFRVRP
jgi:hypothetical protein